MFADHFTSKQNFRLSGTYGDMETKLSRHAFFIGYAFSVAYAYEKETYQLNEATWFKFVRVMLVVSLNPQKFSIVLEISLFVLNCHTSIKLFQVNLCFYVHQAS